MTNQLKLQDKEVKILFFLHFYEDTHTTSEIAKAIHEDSEEWDDNELRKEDSSIRHYMKKMEDIGFVKSEKDGKKKRYTTTNNIFVGQTNINLFTFKQEDLRIEGGINIVFRDGEESLYMFPISDEEVKEYLDTADIEAEPINGEQQP